MITTEIIEIDGQQYKYTKSDTYMMRKKGTEEVYLEAIDTMDSNYEYEETEEKIKEAVL